VSGKALLKSDSVYAVVLDGVEYKDLACFIDSMGGYATIGASYDDFRAGTSEYPFRIYSWSDTSEGTNIQVQGTSTSHTLKIIATDSIVYMLDEKFIPDTIARIADVDIKVADMVDSAPETLNTLNELARALGEDPNFATTVATQIGTLDAKIGDTSVSEQISEAIAKIPDEIYVQNEEPVDAQDGALWLDMDDKAQENLPINGIPDCSESDNDKFLRVVNGVATWVSIFNAEEASF
jgi:hypothetical protein